jgi:peptidoglycan/xylan/chitin deacetylase (PgdA/CDA1 family)
MIQIVQCWDDGVLDDIRLCEILRAHGAKASFNLNTGSHDVTRSTPWKYRDCKDVIRLARGELTSVYEGFTIANHTVSHPWALKISVSQWRAEVLDGRKQLQDIF